MRYEAIINGKWVFAESRAHYTGHEYQPEVHLGGREIVISTKEFSRPQARKKAGEWLELIGFKPMECVINPTHQCEREND